LASDLQRELVDRWSTFSARTMEDKLKELAEGKDQRMDSRWEKKTLSLQDVTPGKGRLE
jgi:hypothetical protein